METIFFDGAADPNPGKAAFGFSHMKGNVEVYFSCGYIGVTTNNVAEYTALLKALEYLKFHNIKNVDIYGDSLLVVNQINGKWKVKSLNLQNYQKSCKNIIDEVNAKIHWIPRNQNERADYLSKIPLTHCT